MVNRSAPSCAKISTGKSAHLLEDAKSGPLVSQIPLISSHFFSSTHSVTGAELTDGMKAGNNFSRAEAGTLALLQFIQELAHPGYLIFTSWPQDKPSTNVTLLHKAIVPTGLSQQSRVSGQADIYPGQATLSKAVKNHVRLSLCPSTTCRRENAMEAFTYFTTGTYTGGSRRSGYEPGSPCWQMNRVSSGVRLCPNTNHWPKSLTLQCCT